MEWKKAMGWDEKERNWLKGKKLKENERIRTN